MDGQRQADDSTDFGPASGLVNPAKLVHLLT